nr:HAD family hydrolase [Rhizobium laguerreae]
MEGQGAVQVGAGRRSDGRDERRRERDHGSRDDDACRDDDRPVLEDRHRLVCERQAPENRKALRRDDLVPMRELLDYLRANGFKTYIVSGGGVEFMRPMTEKMYGIPPEQVVGSTITTEYATVGDEPVLNRLPKIDFVDDGAGKPSGINKFIGRKPIFVAGNSDGDYEMLRWVTAKAPSFAMIVHHTDAEREVAYDRKSEIGKLDKALDEAERRNWLVVDMKADWKKVFAFEK